MDIKNMNKNFSIEALLDPRKVNDLKNQFQMDYMPLWHFLDNMERKVGGFDKINMKEILEAVYEFATINVSLDKADTQTRIDNLTEQNIKWFTKADSLQTENEVLKYRIKELETRS
jgi:uncharacterized protein YfdQ (DUF2303 family)